MKGGIFAETFWTPFEEERVRNHIGKPFDVLGTKPKDEYDFNEVGPLFIIQFEDGTVLEVFPEEIIAEEQVRSGRDKSQLFLSA